jgi:hypothetical protein
MSIWLARVEMQQGSLLPEDKVVNSFVINDPDGEIELEGPLSVTQALDNFYNQVHLVGGVNKRVSEFLSPCMSRTAGAVEVKYYEITGALDGDEPVGSPFVIDTFTLGAAVGTGLPAEVAAVLTLRGQDWQLAAVEAPDGADAGTAVDRPKQRHTGRLFIGPLTTGAVEGDGSNRARLGANCRGAILNACSTLQEELTAQPAQKAWCMWSRRDAVVRRIVRGEVDNAFDTQRRRGEAATLREATGAL